MKKNSTKKNSKPFLSLVIPVYNEEKHLNRFLEEIDKLKFSFPHELIFIDDCSKDSSYSILNSFQFKSNFQIFKQDKNQGKGAAIRRGFEVALGDVIGVQDADFEYDMKEIASLIQPFLTENADIVFGSRFRKENRQVHRTFHYLVNRFLTLVSNLLSGMYLSDMETCYKFFKADIIKNIHLESNRFGFEPEITAKIARLKAKIMELPISYYPRNYYEGKKITWKDGVAALRHLFVYNIIKGPKSYFKKELPESYIPKTSNWL
ncbi:MAG: glycosyltransferase family 2 protein [Leptospiraceae bacterium]|nr:glycosyltransferase family 2 protein [Leptospiraceae bacterium]